MIRMGDVGRASGWRAACAAALLACLLGGCGVGKPAYTPVVAGIDPYARLRERSEEYYQAGLAYERAADWRRAMQSYEQATLWDPDKRATTIARLDNARAMVASLDPAAPNPTPTLRPVGRGAASPVAAVVTPGGVTTPIPTPTAARRTPTPTPLRAGYRTFRSKGLPYTIAYPSNWAAREGAIADQEKRADAFVGLVAGRSAASVLVFGVPLGPGLDAEQFYLQITEPLRGESDYRELTPRTVGGTVAYIVAHTAVEDGKTYSATHAIFRSGSMGWLVTLVTTPDAQGDARAIFDAMLATFQPDGDIN